MSDYALVEGMAVKHDAFGEGEIINMKPNGRDTATVNFSGTGRRTVWLSDMDIDWKFYRDGESVHK
jgi:hypothetical protein